MEDNIYTQWLALKRVEANAAEERRLLEDQMIKAFDIAETDEGVKTINADTYKIKITTRLNHAVDSDSLQELAAEYGLTEHLSTLFRWKPALDIRRWKDASQEITGPLSAAITTKAGRPSFSIEVI
jgi:hypothetical protein